jgi:peptidoglycan/LPS O-acetylase OafA/YrhL
LMATMVMVWVWRAALLMSGVSIDYLYRALDTRADHLLVGCLVAVLVRLPSWQARIERLAGVAWWVLALALALYASSKLDAMSAVYKYGIGFVIEPLLVGLLIPLVVLAAQPGAALQRLLNNALMVEVGRVSYGLYLFHGMVLYSVQRFVLTLTGRFDLALLVSFAVMLVFASVLFRWFEMPLRRWISGDAARRVAA